MKFWLKCKLYNLLMIELTDNLLNYFIDDLQCV